MYERFDPFFAIFLRKIHEKHQKNRNFMELPLHRSAPLKIFSREPLRRFTYFCDNRSTAPLRKKFGGF
jgi:hypothetical protein